MGEGYKRKSAHERIMELRAAFDIPEENTTKEEDALEEQARAARLRRMELAGTNENYVKLFNRDPWTDEWLGPGPEPPDPFMETPAEKPGKKAVKLWNAKSYADWKRKYYPEVPTVHLPAEPKESKEIRKLRKRRKKHEDKIEAQHRYDVAYWFLESWCTKKFRNELYYKYAGRLDELVQFCYEYAMAWCDELTNNNTETLTVNTIVCRMIARHQEESDTVVEVGGLKFKPRSKTDISRREYVADPYENPFPDIPDEYWEEFSAWADKHPLKQYRKKAASYGYHVVDASGLRRIAFLKKINRRNRGFRKNLLRHDPLSGAAFVSKKKYKSHMQKQLHKFDQHRRKFIAMLDDMVESGQISPELSERMMGDTQLVRQRVLKRHQEAYDRIKFNQKEIEKVNRRKKKEYEARKKWFKAHGSDIGAPAFTVDIDGEEYTYEVQKGGKKPIFIARGPKSIETSESAESFLSAPAYMSTEPPVKPKGLGPGYDELPQY